MNRLAAGIVALSSTLLIVGVRAQDMPRIEHRGDRYSLLVDGKPFLMLGAQVNNSSSWPATLPAVWPVLAAMHANTVEAPAYWQQIEPKPNVFDFANVDLLISQAREHHLHLVLLWFGTWKNGANHYVPDWVKSDTVRYPRVVSQSGRLLDVMSPHSVETLQADKHAFAALMHHVREFDSGQHTVILVQVENEAGSFGAARDFSPVAQKLFEQPIPNGLVQALHLRPVPWSQAFGADADESFNAFYIARYVNEVAKAGKAEYPLPMYCNAWISYPVRAPEGRDRAIPGQAFPSGGPQQANITIWKAAAPSIDALAPDFYSQDTAFFRQILSAYARPDNALFIPEIGVGGSIGGSFFDALGTGAFGFAAFGAFGTDGVRPSSARDVAPPALAEDFGLVTPVVAEIAQLNFEGKVRTAVQQKPGERVDLHFGDVDAAVSFVAPGPMQGIAGAAPTQTGRILVAQTAPLAFLVVGVDATVSFRLATQAAGPQSSQLEILQAEEGSYVDESWKSTRILNGDQTEWSGLSFRGSGQGAVLVTLQEMPLYDPSMQPH